MKRKFATHFNLMRNNIRNNTLVRGLRNPPKAICDHLLGHTHTEGHRMLIGVIIMLFGVCFSKAPLEGFFHIMSDMTGYFIHAVGAIPFIEKIEKWRKGNGNETHD